MTKKHSRLLCIMMTTILMMVCAFPAFADEDAASRSADKGQEFAMAQYNDPHYNTSVYGTYTTDVSVMATAISGRYGNYAVA